MIESKLILFLLVLARVGGLTMTAPIYGTKDVPLQVRAVLAASLAFLVVPSQWNAAVANPANIVNLVLLLGGEALIGVCLGLGILILLHGMTMAGSLIAQTSGLSVVEAFDPTLDESTPLFSRLMFLVALTIFLCMGGHRMVMAGLLDTFRAIPPGGGLFPESMAEGIVTLVGQSFALAIRAAAPAVTALLLASILLGLVSRTLPQLNILSVGFGLNAMLAFAVLGLTLGTAAWAFQDQIEPALETLFDALQTPLQGKWLS